MSNGLIVGSQRYNASLYSNLFKNPDNPKNWREIAALAKVSELEKCQTLGIERWLQFSLNPIGDPEMPIYVTTPKEFKNVVITKGDFMHSSSKSPNCLTVEAGTPGCVISVTGKVGSQGQILMIQLHS